MSKYEKLNPPAAGRKISIEGGVLRVPDNPIIPFIEGDGTGPDIWRASQLVFDAAVAKAYKGARSISVVRSVRGRKIQCGVRRRDMAAR